MATEISEASRYGRLDLAADGAITAFGEKAHAGPGIVNAGVYLARRAVFESVLPDEEHFSFEREVLPKLAGHGLYGVVSRGMFIDIGLPEDYKRAQRVLAGRVRRCL
jgi:NDP-sugar pyrophosphorylase family protein